MIMQFILEHISDIFAFGCISAIAIEKNSNIKFKPLTWLGNQVNSDMKKEIETTNKKIDDIQDQINDIKYKNAMKDLADVRNRLISYGLLMQKGEKLDCDVLKNIQHDLDVYDYYKEMIEYSKTLEFDGAGHEIHSPQVEAWVERHKNKKSEK